MNTDDRRDALIRYRLERSDVTLQTAMRVMESGDWNSVVNRLYYAAFYAVLALMTSRGFKVNSHNGAKHLLNVHFTNTGLLDITHNSTFGRLFNARQKGDYDDFELFSESDAQMLLAQTKEFITAVRQLITN